MANNQYSQLGHLFYFDSEKREFMHTTRWGILILLMNYTVIYKTYCSGINMVFHGVAKTILLTIASRLAKKLFQKGTIFSK